MRVTSGTIQLALKRDLSKSLERIAETQQQVSSGLRIQKGSDDPVGAVQVMRFEHSLRAFEQYRRNSSAARVRLTTEESVLSQVSDMLTRAKELGVAQGSDTADAATRVTTAQEVDRLLEQVYSLGNSKVGNEYVFGGGQTATSPFVGGAYVGDTTIRQTTIGDGLTVSTNHTGAELLVDSNVINALTTLRDALLSADGTAVKASLFDIDSAFQSVQRLLTEVGGNIGQLDTAATALDDLEFNTLIARSDIRDVSLENATTDFVAAQTTLEAARAAASRLLNQTLADFLR